MATRKEILEIGGREVSISNPDKVYFPEPGYTKLDLVSYYLAVADGALRGAGGRPMALKRFVDGARRQPFFQKRAPENPPDWIRTAELTFPSGRTADEIVLDEAAGLAWVVNLGCIDLNPHPVRAEDLDHPDELRVDLDPVPGIAWAQIRDVALVCQEALEAVGLVGWPKTSGSRGIHINVRIEPRWTYPEVRRAALALARDVERAGARRSRRASGGRRSATASSSTTTRTPRTGPSPRPTPSGRCPTPGSRCRCRWDEVADVEAEDFTIATVPALVAERGDAGRRDRRGGRLARGAARAERPPRGRGPGRRAVAAELREAGRRAAARPAVAGAPAEVASTSPGAAMEGGPPPEVAAERAAAVAAGDTNAGLPTEWAGLREARRRLATDADRPPQDAIPVIEICRAASKDEALEGLERWKARHPEVGAAPRAGRRPGRRDARPLRRSGIASGST